MTSQYAQGIFTTHRQAGPAEIADPAIKHPVTATVVDHHWVEVDCWNIDLASTPLG